MPIDCSDGPKRARRAEQQRRGDAAQRVPAREDDERHRHQALARGQALVPRARIGERQERAADAGEKPANRCRQEPHQIDRNAHGARGRGAVAHRPHDQAPARVAESPGHQQLRATMPMKKQRIDLQGALQARAVAPEAERDRAQPRRRRLDVGLAEEEGDADAEQHHGDADRDVVHPRQAADRAVHRAERGARQRPPPGRRPMDCRNDKKPRRPPWRRAPACPRARG